VSDSLGASLGRLERRLRSRGSVSAPSDADAHARHVLAPLMVGYPYLPITYMTPRPLCLVSLLNDVALNDRRKVIELGTGVSTFLLARLAVRNELDLRVTSVDHDADWLQAMESGLAAEGLADRVELVHAPLTQSTIDGARGEWYDEGALREGIGDATFDLLFVDGPPGFPAGRELSRYPALPFLLDHLAARCAVVIDDANRGGEQAVIARWEQVSSFRFERPPSQDFAIATRGEARVVRLL